MVESKSKGTKSKQVSIDEGLRKTEKFINDW
jgi:hypothetical protein